ncbi:response regulator receiver domain [Chryseobacterium limigenitum]|uniref:Response receiver domain-containing protein n=1 Tax=Chryseobacterium limigenitum TaxID=1612149 RepID=A0A1K2IL02_9FLAO|nr:response regulator receiver domain [Chryseobacterium limigenitum]SFZ93133.1 hypothetical protein SAMN05216324_104158 [Chryseobacterium limigenitum]
MYSQKAFDILNLSINNAIFIDEKAKDFYSGTEVDPNISEEKLSFDLFNTFKKNGKNLSVHKFEKSNLDDPNTIEYLFKGKDLILLDWELAELAGQEFSLKLLSKAISAPYINFCCIYSSSTNFNQIPLFLDTFFSGLSKEDFEKISNEYSFLEKDELRELLNKDEETITSANFESGLDLKNFPIEFLKGREKSYLVRLIHISLNIDQYILPDDSAMKYEVMNTGDNSFMINNTFVLTLKKDFTEDSDITKLLTRISEVIIKNKGSFFQLLGLEMQSVFNSNERFIDETILKSSTEALFQFRNHLSDDKIFGSIIKKLLIEQATLKLRTAKLELLKPEFLDFKSKDLKSTKPTNDDLFQLNVFYNSVTVNGLNSDSVPNLNFGDIFKGAGKDYYLCITALCDCYYPDKIQSNFYFAKGLEFEDLEMALRLGDTAFLSFLPNGKVVLWGDKEIVKNPEKAKKREDESEEEFKLRKENEHLKFEAQAYKKFLYKPFFIKPKVFNVENNKLVDKKIRIWDITNKLKTGKVDQNLNYFDVEYITTLREDYAQRISNHAFGHPSRVGVDFVKIK